MVTLLANRNDALGLEAAQEAAAAQEQDMVWEEGAARLVEVAELDVRENYN